MHPSSDVQSNTTYICILKTLSSSLRLSVVLTGECHVGKTDLDKTRFESVAVGDTVSSILRGLSMDRDSRMRDVRS
jgi:hypothetical protein